MTYVIPKNIVLYIDYIALAIDPFLDVFPVMPVLCCSHCAQVTGGAQAALAK